MRMVVAFLLATCLLLLGATEARAAQCINQTNGLSNSALSFGTVNPFTLPQNTTATLTLTFHNAGSACTSTPVAITMSNGTGAGATAANRLMTSGTNTLSYTIYQPDAATGTLCNTTTVWDNTTAYNSPSYTIPKNSDANFAVTICGHIFGGQATSLVGAYTDTLIITATF